MSRAAVSGPRNTASTRASRDTTSNRRPRDRGRLHPAAQRLTRRLDDRRAPGGKGRALREAALRHVGGHRARPCCRARDGPPAVGGVRVPVPRADGTGARDARRRDDRPRCARSSRGSISCWTIPDNIRLFADLAGGSIQDVGCYPIRLARLLFDGEPDLSRAIADAEWTADGADTELWGALVFPGDRRLVFPCGFRSGSTRSRAYSAPRPRSG